MIITQTPFRMSFFGGGTDMESFFRENGGAVLSTSFDKYCYVNVRHLPRCFDYSTELSYSRTERVTDVEDIRHPAIRNAMKMLDMYEIRQQLEGLAARRAAEKISDGQLRDMREALDLQHFYCDRDRSDSSDQIKNMDSRFHELLYLASGSRAYCDVLCRLHKKIAKYRMASVRKRSRAEESVREHEAIYEALAAHDPDRAEAAALTHILRARASMEEMEF
jgi:DNA-binding FadR family transcriptional regulator